MILYSTNNQSLRVPFREAVFNSLPADRGLYMPLEIPVLDPQFIRDLPQFTLPEIAAKIAQSLLGDSIPVGDLEKIVKEAINFDAPLRLLDPGTAVLELFHGPSLAFKDFGARFMSRIMGYLAEQDGGQKDHPLLDVLVATSGDTGGAVALGFLGVEGTRVTILYPKGKVSAVQEQQLTTNGQNIRALEVEGTFDDCQALVKQAFNDPELRAKLRLTSANSINISRLIPQTFYYFYAYAQLRMQGINEVVFVVPSGNFGNIGAGLLAWKMGLPAKHFVAATNANDTVPRFLQEGQYQPHAAIPTLSNAMDVADPSNWTRIMEIFKGNTKALTQMLSARSYTDEETQKAIAELDSEFNYVACPHTALGWKAAMDYRREFPGEYASVFLSTAHPCKFPDVFTAEQLAKVGLPSQVRELSQKETHKTPMKVNYSAFKSFLLE